MKARVKALEVLPLAPTTPVRLRGETRVGEVIGVVRPFGRPGQPRCVVRYPIAGTQGSELVSVPIADLEVVSSFTHIEEDA